MNTTNVLIKLADKIQFDLFGAFIKGNEIILSASDSGRFVYECLLNDYQLVIAKTQFKSVVTEL